MSYNSKREDCTTDIVKSAARVLGVFEMFGRERRPLTLKDVRGRLTLAPSSGAAILKSLVALGYLDYDRRTRSYFPTMRIALLGQWVPGALFGDGGKVLKLMPFAIGVGGNVARLEANEAAILAALRKGCARR